MARPDRRPSPDLKRDLFKNTKAYSFFQAVRLLHFYRDQEREASEDEFLERRIRVRPLLSLGFPETDINKIEEKRVGQTIRYILTATFLGLYGPGSPMPSHYTEDLLEEASHDKSVTRDFLDVFSEPFYRLFFQSWMKYRWHLKIAEEEDEACLERLSCLLGLGLEEFRQAVPRSRRLLRYIGLFTQFPRSALSLRALLSDALDLPRVDVVPCIPQKVQIPREQRCLIGIQGSTLGDDCYLGREIEDRMGKFRISAGPMDENKFHALLPTTDQFREVGDLVHVFLLDPLEYELELVLEQDQARTIVLGGEKWSGLGYDTWAFSGSRLEAEAKVTFQLGRQAGARS